MSAWPLAFDPAVPHRDRLLDARAMRDCLASHLPDSAATWRVAKAKYHPGRDLRVVYSATVRNRESLLVARSVPCSNETRFSAFPRDRRLPALPDLMRPAEPLRALLGGAWTSSRLAGYAPEKSAVVACINGNPARPLAYAKLFAHERDASAAFAIASTVAERFRGNASICRVPTSLRLATSHLLIAEPAAGNRLIAVDEDAATHAAGRLGAALAEVHGSGLTWPVAAHGSRSDDARLEEAARIVALARPDLATVAASLADRLRATRPDPSAHVPLHGDVHLKNALLDGERVWLIDFDQAHMGPAAADLGSFLAVLRSEALCGARTQHGAAAMASAFLRGYAARRPLPRAEELRWHTSAALLGERARRAVTRVRRGVLVHLSTLLEDADRSLRRGLS